MIFICIYIISYSLSIKSKLNSENLQILEKFTDSFNQEEKIKLTSFPHEQSFKSILKKFDDSLWSLDQFLPIIKSPLYTQLFIKEIIKSNNNKYLKKILEKFRRDIFGYRYTKKIKETLLKEWLLNAIKYTFEFEDHLSQKETLLTIVTTLCMEFKVTPELLSKYLTKGIDISDLWKYEEQLSITFLNTLNILIANNSLKCSWTYDEAQKIMSQAIFEYKGWSDLYMYSSKSPQQLESVWDYLKDKFQGFHLEPHPLKGSSGSHLEILLKYHEELKTPFFEEEVNHFIKCKYVSKRDLVFCSRNYKLNPLKKILTLYDKQKVKQWLIENDGQLLISIIQIFQIMNNASISSCSPKEFLALLPTISPDEFYLTQKKFMEASRYMSGSYKKEFKNYLMEHQLLEKEGAVQIGSSFFMDLSDDECLKFSNTIQEHPENLFEGLKANNFRIYTTRRLKASMVLESGILLSTLIEDTTPESLQWHSSKVFLKNCDTNNVAFFLDTKYTELIERVSSTSPQSDIYVGSGYLSLNGALLGILVNSDDIYLTILNFFEKNPLPNNKVYLLKGRWWSHSCSCEYGVLITDSNHENIISILNQKESSEITKYLSDSSSVIQKSDNVFCSESKTILNNTEKSLSIYDNYFKDIFSLELHAPFKLFLCLHNIGQNETSSFDSKQKTNRHHILKIYEEKNYLSASFLRICLALVEHDLANLYFKKKCSLEELEDLLSSQAVKAQLPLTIFFKLYVIAYLCCTGNDFSLENHLSLWTHRLDSGRYILKNKEYEEDLCQLEQRILGKNPSYFLDDYERYQTFPFKISLKNNSEENEEELEKIKALFCGKLQKIKDIFRFMIPQERILYTTFQQERHKCVSQTYYLTNRPLKVYKKMLSTSTEFKGIAFNFESFLMEKIQQGQAWLDSGAGECIAILDILKQNPEAFVTAVTLDNPNEKKELLQYKNFSIIEEDINFFEKIPSNHSTGRFDVITDVFGPLSYVDDFQRVLNIYDRSLNPGGTIIFILQKKSCDISAIKEPKAINKIVSNNSVVKYLQENKNFKVSCEVSSSHSLLKLDLFILNKVRETKKNDNFQDLFLISGQWGTPPKRIYYHPPIISCSA